MKTVQYFFNIFLFFSFFTLTAQNEGMVTEDGQLIKCAADHLHEIEMATNPLYKANFEERNSQIYQIIRQQQLKKKKQGENNTLRNNPQSPCLTGPDVNVITIPLVVYIVHPTSQPNPGDGNANPTDAQIIDGIQHLNDALRNIGAYAGDGHGANDNSNPDANLLASVDVEIQYCLAKRDINGNPSAGIYRIASDTYTDLDIDSEIANMKAAVEAQVGVGLFPDSDYTGAWLFNELCSNSSGLGCGIGGYAGPSLGVLNLARLWGPNTNASKVHIHEFGHYMSLAHTFNGGCDNNDCLLEGDFVCDTPPENSTSPACNTSANTCSTDLLSGPFTVDQDDLYENYMDYSTNACQNTFTQGQKDRMRASITGRPSLVQSKGCIDPLMAEAGITRVIYPTGAICTSSFSPIIEIENNGNTTLSSIQFSTQVDGGTAVLETKSINIGPGATTQLTLNPASVAGVGAHNVFIEIIQINNAPADSYIRNNYYCRSFVYSLSTAPDYCEDAEDGVIDNNFVIYNPSNDGTFDISNTTNCSADNGFGAIRYYSRYGGTGTEDALLLNLDLTGLTNAQLKFDLSYKSTYSNRQTTLDVGVSTDCGLTYTSQFNKTGTSLSTLDPDSDYAVDYVPTSCDDWATEIIDLTSYSGSEITVRFQATLGGTWGQNLYLDNICTTTCDEITPPASACAAESPDPTAFLGIGQVVFNTIDVSSGYANEDNPATGYIDFSGNCANATTVVKEDVYPLTVYAKNNSNATKKVKAWIDFNNNNVFDASEMVLDVNGFTRSSPAVANVTIPATAVTGVYLRMRVLMAFNTISGPCHSPTYGQAEDYAILVEGCTSPTDIYPTTIATAGTTITANKECPNGSWTDYYDDKGTPNDDTDDQLLLSINTANQNIGTIGDGTFTVTVGISSGGASAGGATLITAPYVTNPMGWYVMNRYWNVIPNPQPANPVTIRFPYQSQDLADVLVDVPAVTHTDLYFYHIEGTNSSNPDGNHGTTTSAEFTEYANGPNATLDTWVYSNSGGTHFATYQIPSFSGGGGGSGGAGGGALPVELISFEGNLKDKAIELNWKTEVELNNDYFTLERSRDGINFEVIATVRGAGNSNTPKRYDYLDRTPHYGLNYYRLSQTDFDETTTFVGKIISVQVNEERKISLYPNPVTSVLHVDLGRNITNTITYEVYDVVGRLVMKNMVNSPNETVFDFDVNSLEVGLYLIKIQDAEKILTTQFVKNK